LRCYFWRIFNPSLIDTDRVTNDRVTEHLPEFIVDRVVGAENNHADLCTVANAVAKFIGQML